MSEVKRFYQSVEYKDAAHMKEHPEGEYVLYSDFEKLKAQLERAESVIKFYIEDDDVGDRAREYFKEKKSK